jgi:HEPN domain-containing protein
MTAEMAADARTWLDSALENRRWAQHNIDGGYDAQACFACQQSVEKLLKAFLLAHNAVPPKIHDLVRLVGMCAAHEPQVSQFEEIARILDQYHAATRYPDVVEESRGYTREEAEEACGLVDRILMSLQPAIEARIEE